MCVSLSLSLSLCIYIYIYIYVYITCITYITYIALEGDFAYGMLQGEEGTHRLVRIWNGKRQTTFAGVEVIPTIPDDALSSVELKDSDLVYSTFRSGGKGGQNVNKVETGVRIEHVPTGITVKCTEERTQGLNKSRGLKRLKEL